MQVTLWQFGTLLYLFATFMLTAVCSAEVGEEEQTDESLIQMRQLKVSFWYFGNKKKSSYLTAMHSVEHSMVITADPGRSSVTSLRGILTCNVGGLPKNLDSSFRDHAHPQQDTHRVSHDTHHHHHHHHNRQ